MSLPRLLILVLPLLAQVLVGHAAGQSFNRSPMRGQPIILFDGSSMDGWTRRDGNASDGWVIQDGTLHRSKRAGDLYFNYWFSDFELVFEWKLEKGGNSGVKYRVRDYGKQSLGCEYQCQDDQTTNKHSAGALYALYAPDSERRKLKPVGQWNQSKIVVFGNHIEHWLNGERVVSAEVGSADWLARVAKSKFRDKPGFGQNQWGRIFLQDHGNPVWFRNIVLTPLMESSAPAIECPSLCPPPRRIGIGRIHPFNPCRLNGTIQSLGYVR